MKIKSKILSGFTLIIMMLIIAGLMSISEFSRLSKSVDAFIDDNYKTIEASKTMIDALEKADSGILLLSIEQWKEGQELLQSADNQFLAAFEIAKNNITETDEDKYIDQIEKSYQKFKEKWEANRIDSSQKSNIAWFFTELHPYFLSTNHHVQALMTLNQDSMHKESTELKEKARRAIMPSIVAIIASLLFLVILNFLISKYYVKPIADLINSLKIHHSQTLNFNAGITTKDEFKELEKEIQNLIYKMNKSNKS